MTSSTYKRTDELLDANERDLDSWNDRFLNKIYEWQLAVAFSAVAIWDEIRTPTVVGH